VDATGRERAAVSRAIWIMVLAKAVCRDVGEPFFGLLGLALAQLPWRIDGAGRAALDLDKDVVLRLIASGERECVVRRNGVVTDAGELRHVRGLPCDQRSDRRRTGLALRAGGRSRFRNPAAQTGIADDMDIGHKL